MTALIITEWVALAILGFAICLKKIREVNSPRRLRHDSGHQRLERGRFSKGAGQNNHNGEIAPIRERNHG